MTVDRSSAANVCAPSSDDVEARRRDARRRSNQRARCSRCGQFESGPGGAGFGDGKTFCDRCAVQLDFQRGDGRTQ